ncbi:hypothetical protein TNCV_853281 [Trichonephila clavipes]|nr:hypothetical protein TNCV_853281 [Trichonephila clavipes]
MVLKAKANDRRPLHPAPCHDEFGGPRTDYVRQLHEAFGDGPRNFEPRSRVVIRKTLSQRRIVAKRKRGFGAPRVRTPELEDRVSPEYRICLDASDNPSSIDVSYSMIYVTATSNNSCNNHLSLHF